MAYKRKEKKSLLLYYDYKDQFEMLTDEQLRKLIYAMIEYDKNDVEIELDKITKMAFVPIKRKLRDDKKEWNTKCNINSENGKKSHQKRELTTVNDRQRMVTKLTDKDKDKEKDIDKEKDKDRECENKFSHIGDFVAPTLTEIFNYSKSLNFDDKEYCERFYNHYESIGWVNGTGQEIKNWKLVFSNWLKKDKKSKGQQEDVIEYKNGFKYVNGKRML